MNIINISINKLIPYENNSRTHSTSQVNQIVASISEFGFTNPILISEEMVILAGHGRYLASKVLGSIEIPTITLKGLSESQKKAYIIADNKIAENSGWDEDLLRLELISLDDLEFDYSEIMDFKINDDLEVDNNIFEEDNNIDKEDIIKLSVECENITDKKQLKEELLSRGFKCQ